MRVFICMALTSLFYMNTAFGKECTTLLNDLMKPLNFGTFSRPAIGVNKESESTTKKQYYSNALSGDFYGIPPEKLFGISTKESQLEIDEIVQFYNSETRKKLLYTKDPSNEMTYMKSARVYKSKGNSVGLTMKFNSLERPAEFSGISAISFKIDPYNCVVDEVFVEKDSETNAIVKVSSADCLKKNYAKIC